MRLKLNYKRSLSNFLGEIYKELPLEDMEMFCLLTGAELARMIAKMMANMSSSVGLCDETFKKEEKTRIELYDTCYNLIKGYICEINNLSEKEYYNWYKDMRRNFESNKEFYTEKCKDEGDKIINVITVHMVKKSLANL